jgi:hypothetical protein
MCFSGRRGSSQLATIFNAIHSLPMRNRIKSTMMLIAGLCWLAAALVIVVFLYHYLTEGAGLQVLGFLSIGSASILFGLAQVIGFAAAAAICSVCEMMLCALGLAPIPREQTQAGTEPKADFAVYRHLFTD